MKSVHIYSSIMIVFVVFWAGEGFAQNTPGPNEALFYLTPASGSVSSGSGLSVDLKISVGASTAITSIKAYLSFDASKISVSSINTDIGDFTAWWEKTANNSTGKLQLQASVPAPGITGANGFVARLNLLAVNTGTANITYDASSLILESDDDNIWSSSLSGGGSFTITAPSGDGGDGDGGGGGVGGGGGDTAAPVVSDIQSTSISTSSAVITWKTNEPATSQVDYGVSETYGYTTLIDTSLVTAHQVTLSGLTPNTKFNFKTISKDASGNKTLSANNVFTTLAAAVVLVGDFNADGKVNIFDFSMLLSNWGTAVVKYDLNKDGKVSIFDLSILLSNWTK